MEAHMKQVCPKCGEKLERQPKMYHWRGATMHGWVCVPCKSLWDLYGAFATYVSKHS